MDAAANVQMRVAWQHNQRLHHGFDNKYSRTPPPVYKVDQRATIKQKKRKCSGIMVIIRRRFQGPKDELIRALWKCQVYTHTHTRT